MKKFGFIKKITAAATAAAMVASFGISAFADTVGNPGNGITINSVNVTEIDTTNEIYKVTVGFTSTSTNNIGMTMLTYGNSNDSSMTLGSSWSENQYQSTGMKVIGVDQIAGVSNGTGTFEFNVTTKVSAGDIYLKKGSTALIALSGDGVSVPAVAPLTITATATYAAPVTINDVALAANLTADEIQDTIKEALQTKAVTTSVYEKSTDTTALKENVPLYGDNVTIGTFTKAADSDVYTGTVTINAVDGVNVQTGGISVAVTVNTVKTAVEAAKATAVEGMTAVTETPNKFTLTVGSDGNADANAVVANNFVGKTVTLTDSTGTVTGTVAITSEMVTVSEYAVDVTKAYTVTIPSTASTNNSLLTIPSAGITLTVDVTVTSAAVINAITLSGDAINVTVTKGADDAATKAAIEAALNTATAGRTFTVTDTKGGSATNVALSNVTYSWTASGSGTSFTATMNATAVTGVLTDSQFPTEGVTITTPAVTITVNEAPVGMYGDVNNDKVIDYTDVGEIIAYITASFNGQEYPFIDLNDSSKTVDLKFADVTADFKSGSVVVDYSDVGEIIAKITASFNGSDYVFEADK